MRLMLKFGVTAMVVTLAGASQAQAQMRFQGMDRNNDGMISRSEWNGTDRAFRNQDWNGDGVLSGDEVRPGARRVTGWNQDWNHDGIIDQQDTLIAQRFRNYDDNGDSRVAVSEWPGNQTLFRRLDTNGDGYLTMTEYTSNGGFRADSQGGPAYPFASLDRNRDGWITRNEWNIDAATFNHLDVNRDNRISRDEFQNDTTGNDQQTDQRFLAVDRNRDSYIARSEWSWGDAWFDRTDTNNDNRISRAEFDASSRYYNETSARYEDNTSYGREQPQQNQRTRAYQAGFDHGVDEGRMAGREDRTNNHGWDLEGQTELERADSGYYAQLGSLSEYQAGYRDGFRQAYREGYNAR